MATSMSAGRSVSNKLIRISNAIVLNVLQTLYCLVRFGCLCSIVCHTQCKRAKDQTDQANGCSRHYMLSDPKIGT